jgi:hypothetical protein
MAMTVRRTRGGRLHIVNQPDTNGFEVLPKRRLVERAFARISRNRCRARDFEHYATAAAAFGRLAMIRINLRKAAHRTLSERSSTTRGSKEPQRTQDDRSRRQRLLPRSPSR